MRPRRNAASASHASRGRCRLSHECVETESIPSSPSAPPRRGESAAPIPPRPRRRSASARWSAPDRCRNVRSAPRRGTRRRPRGGREPRARGRGGPSGRESRSRRRTGATGGAAPSARVSSAEMADAGPRWLLPFDTFRLPHRLTDVLVVGTGVAGYSAALAAAGAGARGLAVAKGDLDASNTGWAQGGVAAVTTGKEDALEAHARDTLDVGQGLCDPAIVRGVVGEAAERIHDLVGLGV